MATRSMVHLNNNLLCAVDTETTGTDPNYHEIIHLAIIPLDNWLEPRKDLPLFDIKIQPQYMHRVDFKALEISRNKLQEICDSGLESEKAYELFTHWFDKLKLGLYKKIVPLGHNVSTFDMPFIRQWMGNASYETYFHGFARDTMVVANYLNDVSDFHAEQTPFTELKLRAVAKALDIEIFDGMTHDPVYDAYLAAQVYKKMLTHHLLETIG